jgi:UDP-N-acetylmuramoyl-L-alanyl-D-glutamate--2,6-diaminopimelate ligase
MLAREGDIVLVAGKGHETYQEIEGKKYPFDDREILQGLLAHK